LYRDQTFPESDPWTGTVKPPAHLNLRQSDLRVPNREPLSPTRTNGAPDVLNNFTIFTKPARNYAKAERNTVFAAFFEEKQLTFPKA